MTVGNKETTDAVEVGHAFNDHFTNIGQRLASKIRPSNAKFDDYVYQCNSVFELTPLRHCLS